MILNIFKIIPMIHIACQKDHKPKKSSVTENGHNYQFFLENTIELQLKTVDLHSLVNIILVLIKPLVANKKVMLISHVDKTIPYIRADEDRLQQILYNLVVNSIRFTQKGSITIEAIERKQNIVISVKDTGTGTGIDKEKHDSVFDYVELTDDPIASQYSSTGLGLAVAKKLLNLHGSEIHLDLQPGVGSTFSFSLPISQEAIITEQNDSQVNLD